MQNLQVLDMFLYSDNIIAIENRIFLNLDSVGFYTPSKIPKEYSKALALLKILKGIALGRRNNTISY